jgi:hypothetical protein
MGFPLQQTNPTHWRLSASRGNFDMRNWLTPRRLTLLMWDQAFLMRYVPGEAYADHDRVLDEALERGYNTLRLAPLPQLIDLTHPKQCFRWEDPHKPYMPWGWRRAGSGPLGEWLIEFMEKVLARGLNYTLSAWRFHSSTAPSFPREAKAPRTHLEAAELWAKLLQQWQQRSSFERLVYLDIANEVPYFLPGFKQRIKDETGQSWTGEEHEDQGPVLSDRLVSFMSAELNGAIRALQREYPQVRFTASIHGDERWLGIPVQFTCLDAHFYADFDARWRDRTRFADWLPRLFTDATWHIESSDRCGAARHAVAPMLRAAQRSQLAAFAAWAEQKSMPLTTSESWASWSYYDSPDLDWQLLLE